MKIGLPKIRFTRKVLLISVGILALLAGSGAAALYVGAVGAATTEAAEDSPIGGECTTIQTLVMKTPAKRLWLRKYIRMNHADGTQRIKTALRVAGLLAKANTVDLIQVSVLDANGPTLKSQMRGRAIGAEVVLALQPKYLPDMKEPFIVRYYEGASSDEGIYYGDRISLEVPEIRKLMGAMKDVAEKQDCTELPKPGDDKQAKKPGEQIVGIKGEQPAGHEKKPAKEEHKAEDSPEAKDAPKQSMLDSLMSMVGLGGEKDKPAEKHEAKTEDGHDARPPAEDQAAKPSEHEESAAPAENDEDAVEHKPAKTEDAAEKHVEAEPSEADAQPVRNETH